jgi:hypothetical protein
LLIAIEAFFRFSIFSTILLKLPYIYYWLPKKPLTVESKVLNFCFRDNNLSSPFSMMLGKFKNRRVWPVGAVSNTIKSNSIFSTELNYKYVYLISFEKDIASSMPGTELNISLNKFFVDWFSVWSSNISNWSILAGSILGSISCIKTQQPWHID